MRTSTLFVLSLALLSALDLPAQGRGRRGRRVGPPPQQAPTPEPEKKAETKEEPEKHIAIVGGDVYVECD